MDPEEEREADRYKWLRQTDHEASRDFDKAIMTLSAGALGVSIAFIHDVAPDPKMVPLLGVSWIAFALSLLLILFSFLTSQRALRKEMTVGPNRPIVERAGGWFGKATLGLNVASAVALGVGVLALIIFALYNI